MSHSYFAIGLMSGTSLDGLDLCYAAFNKDPIWQFKIIKTATIPYSQEWKSRLKEAIHLSAEDLLAMDKEYGIYLGEKAQEFILKNKITELDLIASHGHTVFHQPHRKFTLQIGDGRAIKAITKKPVVYDFRSQDVLMGGNGAPLVPIGDELLFSEYDACLNLGGFSNISIKKDQQRIAFDISPVNTVLNLYAEQLGQPFDKGGNMARSGTVNEALLQQLSALDFYHRPPPKSLGIEMVNREVLPLLSIVSPANVLATFTEHIALEISKVLLEFKVQKLLVTGGGAYNSFLMEKIRTLTGSKLAVPSDTVIEFKEALIFALMGVLKLRNETNVLCSATGSSEDHSSGILI